MKLTTTEQQLQQAFARLGDLLTANHHRAMVQVIGSVMQAEQVEAEPVKGEANKPA